MTDVPDFRGRVERDQPTDFLHKIKSLIPGYVGYADRERRRDADKMLRTWLGRQYRDQLHRITRVEQDLARNRHMTALPELQRLEGMLNRFIDKLDTASYGYAGLFDAAKVTEVELDQLYAFDQGLANGVQAVGSALDAVEAAANQGAGNRTGGASESLPDLASAINGLESVIDNLLQMWNHRNDVLTSGNALPAEEYERFRANLPPAAMASTGAPPVGAPAPAEAEGEGDVTRRLDPRDAPSMSGTSAPDYSDHASRGATDPVTGRGTMPGGAAMGGSVGEPGGQPMVGGGESFGSPAPYAGAAPEVADQSRAGGSDAPTVSPDAADGSHSTMGSSGDRGQ